METGGASVWRVGRTREYRVGSNVRKRISEPEEEIHALGLTPDLYEPCVYSNILMQIKM